jgi:3-dehydroquinate synthase
MRSLTLNLKDHSYEILIKKGILKNIGDELKKVVKGNKVVVLTDSNVDRLYGESTIQSIKNAGFTVDKIVFKAGEESKSFETVLDIYSKLASFKANRTTTLITLGGGVVGDMGGFVASTFVRGIPFVQIPTTLLAQVDSSIGGKVAVNLPEGKNLVGSFYHPDAVFIDTDALNTLEDRVFNDGMSEVIKYGCIKDKQLFKKLLSFKDIEELKENLEDVIFNCCSIKKVVVEADEKETGERMLLNFGHTIGHAIEKYFDYKEYTHGEGVAIGMNIITALAEKDGLTEPGTTEIIKKILIKYSLPLEVKGLDVDKVIDIIKLDKKNLEKDLNIILLNKIGDSFIHKLNNNNLNSFFKI